MSRISSVLNKDNKVSLSVSQLQIIVTKKINSLQEWKCLLHEALFVLVIVTSDKHQRRLTAEHDTSSVSWEV